MTVLQSDLYRPCVEYAMFCMLCETELRWCWPHHEVMSTWRRSLSVPRPMSMLLTFTSAPRCTWWYDRFPICYQPHIWQFLFEMFDHCWNRIFLCFCNQLKVLLHCSDLYNNYLYIIVIVEFWSWYFQWYFRIYYFLIWRDMMSL